MPFSIAACRTVLPFSTVTCRPLIVSVTVSINTKNTTINAELAEHAENRWLCGFRGFCVACRDVRLLDSDRRYAYISGLTTSSSFPEALGHACHRRPTLSSQLHRRMAHGRRVARRHGVGGSVDRPRAACRASRGGLHRAGVIRYGRTGGRRVCFDADGGWRARDQGGRSRRPGARPARPLGDARQPDARTPPHWHARDPFVSAPRHPPPHRR